MNFLFFCRRIGVGFALMLSMPALVPAQGLPELRIGAVLSETGGAAAQAGSALAVLKQLEHELAVQESLPFKVRFFYEDDGSDARKAADAATKLVRDERVHLLVCCTTGAAAAAVARIAGEQKLALMAISFDAHGLPPHDTARFVFHTQLPERLMTRHMLDYMLARGLRTVAFVARADANGRNGLIDFSEMAEAQGMEVVAAESFSPRDAGFNLQAMRISLNKPDAVFFHTLPPAAALAHESLRRTGYNGPFFHAGDLPSNAEVSAAGKDVEGAVFGSTPLAVYRQLPAGNAQKVVLTNFVRAFEAGSRSRKADDAAGQAHDAVLMAVEAWQRVPVLVQEGKLARVRLALRDSIEGTRNYAGATGVFSYAPDDHRGLDTRSTFLAEVRNGKAVLLTK